MKGLFGVIVLLFLLCGCASQEESSASLEGLGTTTTTSVFFAPATNNYEDLNIDAEPKISLKLNKDTYHSGEEILMDIKIESKAELYNVEVRGYGIYAASRYKLDKSIRMDLKAGTNNATLIHKTPMCNSCSGIPAGTYNIEAAIIYEGKILARDIKSVSIMQ